MSNRLTIQDLERLKKEGKIQGYSIFPETGKIKKESKYGNRKVEFEGLVFDSKKEFSRYLDLRMLLKAGEITDLELQKEYELNEGGSHSLVYVCDFVYKDVKTGEMIYEDVKGFRTAIYKKKKKLMLKVYGITIKEV